MNIRSAVDDLDVTVRISKSRINIFIIQLVPILKPVISRHDCLISVQIRVILCFWINRRIGWWLISLVVGHSHSLRVPTCGLLGEDRLRYCEWSLQLDDRARSKL
jgi:hypothetical protein